MPDYPLVSVVTPSLNQGQFLESTIRSVLEHNYPTIEYFVIDGGSTDESVTIIQSYTSRLAYWISEKDNGQSHAINKGLSRARGEILGWLNSDDVLLPGTINRVVTVFRDNPDVDVVYGHLERIDARGQRLPTPKLPKDRDVFDKSHALNESVVNQAGCFWRRGIMEKVGLLNESLHYCMDNEYWMRILLAGGKFMRVDDTLAQFRLSSGSKTLGQTTKMALEGLSVIESFLAQIDLAERLGLTKSQLQQQANKGLANVCLHAFYGCVKGKKWMESLRWFLKAHRYYPLILLRWKWFDLLIARIIR
jgi:glycosyltransferase involved in cell wall biosynthesis